MATNNSADYKPTRYNVLVGGVNGTITNISPGANVGYVLKSNGASANPSFQSAALTGIATINGDSGSVSGATISFLSSSLSPTSGKTVSFVASSGTEMDLIFTDASNNTAIGMNSGVSLTQGTNNTFLGADAGYSISSGTNNTIIGSSSLSGADVSGCVAIGYSALDGLTSGGNYNVGIGTGAFSNLTSGDSNIGIGTAVGTNYDTTESDNILIGNGGVIGDSNTIRIGTQGSGSGEQNLCFIAGIVGNTITGSAVLIDANGQLGDIVSSIKYKENVQDINEKSSAILNLRPVSFNYKSDKNKTKCYGFIAEEVKEIFPDLVIYKNNEPYSLKYHEMPALLLNEIKKLKKELELLKTFKSK